MRCCRTARTAAPRGWRVDTGRGWCSRRAPRVACIWPRLRAARSGESAEFLQAGIELFGNEDRAASDADVLALAHEAANLFAVDAPQVKIGDEGLFLALLDALGVALPIRRRLRGRFGEPARLRAGTDGNNLVARHA